MKRTAVYLSLGIAAAAGAITVATIEEVPKLLQQAIDRAVAAAVQQLDQKTIRVGGSGA